MNKTTMFGVTAAAALVFTVITLTANSPASEGTEATIGAAQRAQSPQIEAKDVALGDTSTQAVLRTATWDQIVKDDTLRTLLQEANFLARLQDVELQQALSDENTLRVALTNRAFVDALRNKGFARVLRDPRFGPAMANAVGANGPGQPSCSGWACTSNSPVVDGARIF